MLIFTRSGSNATQSSPEDAELTKWAIEQQEASRQREAERLEQYNRQRQGAICQQQQQQQQQEQQ